MTLESLIATGYRFWVKYDGFDLWTISIFGEEKGYRCGHGASLAEAIAEAFSKPPFIDDYYASKIEMKNIRDALPHLFETKPTVPFTRRL